MNRLILETLRKSRSAGLPVALVTDLATGEQSVLTAESVAAGSSLDADIVDAARRALEVDRSETLDTASGRLFVHVFNPPFRLIIVGAVHITEVLARLGELAGYAVTIVDPRRAFAGRSGFAEFTVTDAWPDEALEVLEPDRRTAVITLTHDPKLDDAALIVALRSEAFYIGSLGSRKTHAARLKRLARQGVSEGELRRIHGPVGLAIGALTPAEIAISIVAEMTQIRRHGKSR